MLTVKLILVVAAFIAALLSAGNPARVPLWVAVILLCVFGLLLVLPR